MLVIFPLYFAECEEDITSTSHFSFAKGYIDSWCAYVTSFRLLFVYIDRYKCSWICVVLSIIDPEFRPYSFAFFFIPHFALPFAGTKIGIINGFIRKKE